MMLDWQTWVERDGVVYGARGDERGPIGGGAGYARLVTRGDFEVATVRELLAALAEVKAGQTVFIAPDAELDVTDRVFVEEGFTLTVPAGVTLASNRGQDGAPGALLFSTAYQTRPLITIGGPDARITGLRLRGPDPHRWLEFHHRVFYEGGGGSEAYYRFPNSDGIDTKFDRLEVDNCEISAWSHGGIVPLGTSGGHRFHHNFIHHCQRMGLGYGICHFATSLDVEITHTVFQDNKHHIAGPGYPGTGFTARDNVVLQDTAANLALDGSGPYGQDHLFDMHGGEDRKDGTDIAGTRIIIRNNTFACHHQAVNIRGVAEECADVRRNWFLPHAPGKTAVFAKGNLAYEDNMYGEDAATARVE